MKGRQIPLRLWALVPSLLLLGLPLLHAEPTPSKYRGFTIDDSHVLTLANLDAVRAATREQIDMVCAVGLQNEVLEFFQGVPFVLIPAADMTGPSPGKYGGKERSVMVASSITTTGHKPVLLHELLHAFHEQRLKDGRKNADVMRFYAQAKTLGCYAAKSHMMQNEREYFACAATAYLFGVTAQEPFQRKKLIESQPEVFVYFKTLFGPGAGEYSGSLKR